MRLPHEDFAAVVRNTPLVSIDLIVRAPDGRVLLGRRRNEPAKGVWFVPGGRIVKDETIADAFRRLCREELSLDRSLEDTRFFGVYEHFYDTNFAGEDGFGTHYVVLGYEMSLDSPPPNLPPDQHDRYRWVTVDELLADDTVHAHTRWYFDGKSGQKIRT